MRIMRVTGVFILCGTTLHVETRSIFLRHSSVQHGKSTKTHFGMGGVMSDEQSFADDVRSPETPNGLAVVLQRRSLENIFLAWQYRRDDFWRCYWDERL